MKVSLQLTEKEKAVEEVIKDKEDIEDIHEEESLEKEKEIFKCSKCRFETIHKNGLKIHIKRKHVKASKTCDLCDELFETVRDMKIHKNTHSFNGDLFGSEFKCEDCDYISETIETMEIHIGKCCYDHFECGLCEARFENLEMLDLRNL